MKRPAFQFYPADWRKDAGLQSCSLEARGLWLEMMCIAHECEPYGHLTVNGRAMAPAQIARLVGTSPRDCERLLAELDAAGVPSKTAEGVMFSRRMVRDERLRNVRAEAGRLGGNPALLANKVKQTDNQGDKQTSTPSSSSSSSSSKKPPSPRKRGNVHEFPPGFETLWSEYPRKVGKGAAAKAFARIKPGEALLAEMIQAVQAQRTTEQWRKEGGQFVPHLSTWLNEGRWQDEVASSSGNDSLFARGAR